MSQDIIEYEGDMSLSSESLLKRHREIEHLLANVMVKTLHYGKIPGTAKYSLYKAGAEMLVSRFGLRVIPVIIQETSTEDLYECVLEAQVYSIASGIHLGSGLGSASSSEEKYRWRKAVAPQEFSAASPEKRRTAWKNGKNNSVYSVDQVRTNPADFKNTIIKMAKKRALIDAVLTITAASSFFTQDIEDFDESMREAFVDEDGARGAEDEGKGKGGFKKPVELPYTIRDRAEKDGGGKFIAVEPSAVLPPEFLAGLGFLKSGSGTAYYAPHSPELEQKLKAKAAGQADA